MAKGVKNMKLTRTNRHEFANSTRATLLGACRTCYQKAMTRIAAAKEKIFTESQHAIGAPERLIHLALNEAEAIAWQTTYPHLLFPTLATEKVQALAAWNANQRSVRRSSPIYSRTA